MSKIKYLPLSSGTLDEEFVDRVPTGSNEAVVRLAHLHLHAEPKAYTLTAHTAARRTVRAARPLVGS